MLQVLFYYLSKVLTYVPVCVHSLCFAYPPVVAVLEEKMNVWGILKGNRLLIRKMICQTCSRSKQFSAHRPTTLWFASRVAATVFVFSSQILGAGN